MSIVPALLCIDVEPDRRVPDRNDPRRLLGFERLLSLVPQVRERLASTTDATASFTWCLRMDPQIAEVYGSADWIATNYGQDLERLQAEGDVIGLHQHSWRWCDGWVSDQADDAWVAHCAQVGIDGYREVFGRGCDVYRHGDRFMSTALARQIGDEGVRVDLTVEPGLPAARGLVPSETTKGWLPDTRDAPHDAYRPSRADYLVSDASRDDGLLMMPLTPGVVVSTSPVDDRLMPTGSYETLGLWIDPAEFEPMLRVRLRQPGFSHLAFAIRSDIALLPDAWSNVENNLSEIDRQLDDRHRWCTALDATAFLEARPSPLPDARPETAERVAHGAAFWLLGNADPGYRAGAEAEAMEVLERASRGDEPAEPALQWIDEDAELSCPVCGVSGTAVRIAVARAAWRGGAETGVLRCRYCRAIVLEGSPSPQRDLDDAAIDEHVEYGAGIGAMLATLGAVEPRPGLRFLDVGCGYGFGLDLARFAWAWEGVGVDPWNLAARGRRELEVDIRAAELTPDLELGGEPFDVVLASEIIEHLAAPARFLGDLRRRLAHDGVLVVSTPDASFVQPENPAGDVIALLGLGDHVFLVDSDGLERLLRRAGFRSVAVHEERGVLRGVASSSEQGFEPVRLGATPDLDLLTRYYEARADAAPPDSALRTGMAARHAQCAIFLGDFVAAEAGFRRLREAVLARHGLDLDDPDATRRRAVSARVPMAVAEAHFGLGLLELVGRERPERAATQFAAAAAAVDRSLGGPSAAPAWLKVRAIGHEALALARSEPDRAPAAMRRLRDAAVGLLGSEIVEVDVLCERIFSELVAGGHYDAAEDARPLVPAPGAERAGLDAVFSMAMLALQHDRAAEAAAYFGLCARLAARVDDPDAWRLAETARAHEAMAMDRLTGDTEAGLPLPQPAPTDGDGQESRTRLSVTAVIPVYNGRRHLCEAVESIVAQTEPPDELVLVDDGSSDGGIDVLEGISAPFPITVVHQAHAGQSAARNRAVEHARCEVIAFLDQDDTWHPEHLATLSRPMLEDPAVGWVYCDFDEIDADGRTVTLAFLREHAIQHPRQTLGACLTQDLMVIPSASVIRRQALAATGGFDELLQGYEDDDLYVRVFRSGWRLVFEERALTRFRVHEASSSANGRFAESRVHFSNKLREVVADDRRLNRYYVGDLVAPRFFRSTLDDYVRAVSDCDWAMANRLWADLDHFARLRRDHAALHWKVQLLRNPRWFRRALRLNAALPLRLRPMKDSALRLR